MDVKPCTVLVVDDSYFIRMMHKSLMSRLGMEVEVVENGKEAVDLHSGGASFDIILMDMEMPVIDGIQATKELRDMGVDSSIIGVTSCDSGQRRSDFVAAGLDLCIEKPLTVEKISAFLP